jgi:hypothetical protein
MTHVLHTAHFGATDPPERILMELACPACGLRDPGTAHKRIRDNRVRIFCDGCGAFVTIVLDDEQARAVTRHAAAGELDQ